MKKEVSFYRQAVPCPPSKRLLASFLDFIIVFIVTIVFFAISDLCLSYMPVYTSVRETVTEAQSELYSLVIDSGLTEYDDEGTSLKTSNDMANDYIGSIIYSSLMYQNGDDYNPGSLYDGFEKTDGESDGLYYYYVTFKTENASLFTDTVELSGVSYYKETILKNNENGYFDFDADYPYLTLEACTAADQYLRNSTYAAGEEVYTYVYELYSENNLNAKNELCAYYTPYVEAQLTFDDGKDSMINMRGIALLFSYLLATLVTNLLLPFIFKDGQTICYKVLKIGVVDKEGERPGVWNVILRYLFTFVSDMLIPLMAAFVMFGTDGMYFWEVNILGFYNMFVYGILSALLLIASSIICLATKEKKTIVDLLSFTTVRYGKEFIENNTEETGNEKEERAFGGN